MPDLPIEDYTEKTPAGFPMLPSPYFFVPQAEKVWIPGDPTPSHDRPVKDGLSGHLRITLTAQTPIFIRGPGPHPEIGIGGLTTKEQVTAAKKANRHGYQDFYTLPDGTPAIPATSFNGMLRNVFEIITFSKLQPVPERRFAVRDLKTEDATLYKKWLTTTVTAPQADNPTQQATGFKPTARAAWLHVDNQGHWSLQPCEFARVEQDHLEQWAWDHARKRIYLGARKTDKHSIWTSAMPTEQDFVISDEFAHQHSTGRLVYRWIDLGNQAGTKTRGQLVFTGQPSDRGPRGNKHMEFFFHSATTQRIPVGKDQRKDFELVHCNPKGNPDGEWEFWSKKLKPGHPVPVFYLTEPTDLSAAQWTFPALDADGGNLHAFGLAMMFRLIFKHSMDEGRSDAHRQSAQLKHSGLDAAERLFGFVAGKEALRKRVTADSLRVVGTPTVLVAPDGNGFRTVAGAPRATYYPHYIAQPGSKKAKIAGHYSHPMHEDFRLAGWKRYATRSGNAVRPMRAANQATTELPVVKPPPPRGNRPVNEDICTWFRPLSPGTVFAGDLHFHNLAPWEFGALIWALTFGGQLGLGNLPLCHSIGFGKGIGLGAVQLNIDWQRSMVLNVQSKPEQADAEWQQKQLVAFEDEVRKAGFIRDATRLCSHPAIRELLTLADPSRGQTASSVLHYPGNVKDFATAKSPGHGEKGFCLPTYTELFPDLPAPPLRKSPSAPAALTPSASSSAHSHDQATAHVRLASDYPNQDTFKNLVLKKLEPHLLPQLASQIPLLSKPENEAYRQQFLTRLSSDKKLKTKLRELHPDCLWLA